MIFNLVITFLLSYSIFFHLFTSLFVCLKYLIIKMNVPRLPKTICFGRGSTKTFQRNFPKKSKKKAKSKQDTQVQCTSQEVMLVM